MSPSDSVPALRSIPTADGVGDLVRRRYHLDVTDCVLIRSFVNEVYEIRTPGRRFVFKLYRHGGWTADEVAWEAELIGHLAANGVPVAAVVPLTSGQSVGEVDAAEGVRPYLLSEFVEGTKPRKPFDDELYRSYGRLLARLHAAGETFSTDRHRRPFGLDTDLDQPLSRLLSALDGQEADQRLIEELGRVARERLSALGDRMTWGVRHGDVTLDNVHRTADGLVIHDFDLARNGWLVADLSSCLATPFADAFLAGYVEVRAVGTADLDALPWVRIVESINNLAFHLRDKVLWRGTESLSEGWVDSGLAELRSCADRLDAGFRTW